MSKLPEHVRQDLERVAKGIRAAGSMLDAEREVASIVADKFREDMPGVDEAVIGQMALYFATHTGHLGTMGYSTSHIANIFTLVGVDLTAKAMVSDE